MRPGFFILSYLLEHGEAPPSEIHRALREKYKEENERRLLDGKTKLHITTFASFYRYFRHFYDFHLIEPSGREESRAIYAFDRGLDERKRMPELVRIELDRVEPAILVYYRLTALGRAEPPHAAWGNPYGEWYRRGGSYD